MVVSALSLEDPAATNSVSRFGLCHGSGAILSQVMGWGLSQRKQAARQCELSLRSQALWGCLWPGGCIRELSFPWLLRQNSSSRPRRSRHLVLAEFQLPSASLKTPLPMFDGYRGCLRSKISKYLLLQRAPGGCFRGFASVSWSTGTLHERVMSTCSGPCCTAFQSPLSPLFFFSQYQNHKSSYCGPECIRAAGLSARNRCGRVAEGA